LRALLTEAEAWAATEGDDAGRRAAESLRSALETCGERSAREMIAM